MSFIDKFKQSLGFKPKEKKLIDSSEDFGNEISDYDFIEPVQPFYEIILIRPRSIDDMDYVSDQIIEENNPVIVDLTYFEEEGEEAFQMAGGKINLLRQKYGAESILLSKTSERNMIIIAPQRINIVKKE